MRILSVASVLAGLAGLAACGGPERRNGGHVVAPPPPSSAPLDWLATSALPTATVATRPIMARLSSSDPDCGLDTEGRVWRWSTGEMEAEVPSIRGARSIACAGRHSCIVAADGTAWCWGYNDFGELGDGTAEQRQDPVRVAGLSSVAELSLAYFRSCARTMSDDVFCWGDSEFGKAGDGRLANDLEGRKKVRPGKAILAGATTVAVTLAHACSVMNDGRLSCWGQNDAGSCGQPSRVRYVARPAIVPKSKNLVAVSNGESVTCTIDRDGAVACWGNASDGVLGPAGPKDEHGHPTTAPVATPVPVPLAGKAVEVAVGDGGFACARLSTGAVHCWGNNENGELGDGTTKDRSTPAPVKAIENAIQISAGLENACALVEGGHVYCWGKDVWLETPSSSLRDSAVPVEMTIRGTNTPTPNGSPPPRKRLAPGDAPPRAESPR